MLLTISFIASAQVEHGGEPASEVYGLSPASTQAMVAGLDREMRQERDSLSRLAAARCGTTCRLCHSGTGQAT